jgi:hypothetical protein
MTHNYALRLFLFAAILAAWWRPARPVSGSTLTPVLTQHNDNRRTGAYLDETQLNTANVNPTQFGKLFTRPVDGQIYTQPLYVPGLALAGATHNVIYLATMHNSVYAFDADDPDASQPLWRVSLGLAAPVTYTLPNTTTLGHDFGPPGFHDIIGEVGVLSTPVIDLASHTLYVVALNREPMPPACPCQYHYRLHALDLATGAEKFGGPVVIGGSVPGTAEDGENGQVTFQAQQHNQRTALLLQDGIVYVGFASYGDMTPYHGWLFGYSAATLQQVSAWNATPNSGLGGIWQSGQGLAADEDGKIYLITGNGDTSNDEIDYGGSFVKLDPAGVISGVLPVVDWFAPYDRHALDEVDADLGSGGPLLIPNTHLVLGVGKNGRMYLLDQDDLGGYQEGPDGGDRVLQSFQSTIPRLYPLRGTPVFWNSPAGPRLYQWGLGAGLTEYGLTISSPISANIQTTPLFTSTTLPLIDQSGGYLSLSANQNTPGSGLVWAVRATTQTDYSGPQSVLYAFDAENVSHTLWTSEQNPTRDAAGSFAKFNPPTIANGRVYLATFSNELVVYGIMGAPHFIMQPSSQTSLLGDTPSLTVTVSGQATLAFHWYLGNSGDISHPVGTNAFSFSVPPLAGTTAYWVRANNALGSADSDTAVLRVMRDLFLPVLRR